MKDLNLVVCGCGALGSRIAYEIAYLPWQSITLIDDDAVEENNIPTSAYSLIDLGQDKVTALANMIVSRYNILFPEERPIYEKFLTMRGRITNSLDISRRYFILDCFDNPEARQLTVIDREHYTHEALHIGVAAELSGAVIWDEKYTVPDRPGRGENPVCTGDLGVDIIQKTAALAISIIHRYVATGEKVSAVISGLGIQVI